MTELNGATAAATAASNHDRLTSALIVDNSRLAASVLADLLTTLDVKPIICLELNQLDALICAHRPAAIFLSDWSSTASVADLLDNFRSAPATAALPIILTAHVEDLERPLALLARGADDCLFTPIRREDVAVCLKRLAHKTTSGTCSVALSPENAADSCHPTAAELSQAQQQLELLKQQLTQNELLRAELDAALAQSIATSQQLQSELNSERLQAAHLQAQLAKVSAECGILQQQLQHSTHTLTALRSDVRQTIEAALEQCIRAGADAHRAGPDKSHSRSSIGRAFLGASRRLLSICVEGMTARQPEPSSQPTSQSLAVTEVLDGKRINVHAAHEQLLSKHGAAQQNQGEISSKKFRSAASL